MFKNVLKTKAGSTVAIALAVVTAGTVATASAHGSSWSHRQDVGDLSGYTKDQCKDGGWKNFKDSGGDMIFKNQGQCVAFFARQQGGENGGNNNGHNVGHHQNNGFFEGFLNAIRQAFTSFFNSLWSFLMGVV